MEQIELLASVSKDSAYSGYSTCQPFQLASNKPLASQFETVKQLYKADIGNTVVNIAKHIPDADSTAEVEPVILKVIDLRMLDKTEYLTQHRSEFTIHKEMNHEN